MEFNLGNLVLNLRQQAKVAWPSMVKIYISAIFVLVLAEIVGRMAGLTSYYLVSDPAEIANLSPYIGLISNLCILGWGGSATICIFMAFVTKLEEKFHQRWFQFFIMSGIFSAWLGLDDLLQIHESIGELLAKLGSLFNHPLASHLLEGFVFICYLGLFVVYTISLRKQIQRTEYLFMMMAFSLFAFAIFLDILIPDNAFSGKALVEKTPKFLGIVSWFVYFFRTGISSVQKYIFTPRNIE